MKKWFFDSIKCILRKGSWIPWENTDSESDQIVVTQNKTKERTSAFLHDETKNSRQELIITQQRAIDRKDTRIWILEEINKELIEESNKRSKTSGMLLAVSFTVWGIISGSALSLYGQISPESNLQYSLSDLAKNLSVNTTGYEKIQEGNANVLLLKKYLDIWNEVQHENAYFKKLASLQRELIENQDIIITLKQERRDLERKKTCNR
jgi:hypothetical protein